MSTPAPPAPQTGPGGKIKEGLTFRPVRVAVLTVSDTRDEESDTSGALLAARVTEAGHVLAGRSMVPDEVESIRTVVQAWANSGEVDVVVTTGGTGLTGRDVTPEAVEAVAEKMIPGFGEAFRWLSYATIGTSTIQSRACAVVARGTYVFALPGSTGAVKDGWDEILANQLDNRFQPCNFVELMPRLTER